MALDGGYRTIGHAARAFARVTHVDSVMDPLRALLASASTSVRHLIRDMLIASGRDDEALVHMLRAIVDDDEASRHVAEDALRVAAPIATRSQAAAVMIATRIRRDRSQRIADALSALPLDERVAAARAVASHALADIVATARCTRLYASAALELESARTDREPWARALLACDPAPARVYLDRMRNRPGWGRVLGELPPPALDPLVDLTSPIADVRRRALDTLSRAPRRDHVQALLLATELDMYVTREIEKSSWPTLQAPEWLHLLVAYAPPSPAMSFFARMPPVTEIHVLYAQILLNKLVEEDRARRPFAEPQRLTPALGELAARDVAAYARDHAVPPLDAAALAELEAREADIIARG